MVKVRRVHGDIVEYPVKGIAIKFRGSRTRAESLSVFKSLKSLKTFYLRIAFM